MKRYVSIGIALVLVPGCGGSSAADDAAGTEATTGSVTESSGGTSAPDATTGAEADDGGDSTSEPSVDDDGSSDGGVDQGEPVEFEITEAGCWTRHRWNTGAGSGEELDLAVDSQGRIGLAAVIEDGLVFVREHEDGFYRTDVSMGPDTDVLFVSLAFDDQDFAHVLHYDDELALASETPEGWQITKYPSEYFYVEGELALTADGEPLAMLYGMGIDPVVAFARLGGGQADFRFFDTGTTGLDFAVAPDGSVHAVIADGGYVSYSSDVETSDFTAIEGLGAFFPSLEIRDSGEVVVAFEHNTDLSIGSNSGGDWVFEEVMSQSYQGNLLQIGPDDSLYVLERGGNLMENSSGAWMEMEPPFQSDDRPSALVVEDDGRVFAAQYRYDRIDFSICER